MTPRVFLELCDHGTMRPYLALAALPVLLAVPAAHGYLTGYGELGQWGSFGITGEGQFSHPQYVAVDGNGTAYVGDLGNKRIQAFSQHGTYMFEWGSSGKHPGGFHHPAGIATSGGHVFVADRDLHRVQKFTANGTFVAEWGARGSGPGDLLYPGGMAAHNGTVYVVDTGNHRVQAFAENGTLLHSIGSSGLGAHQLLNPSGIAVDAAGDVYVADKGNAKVARFAPNGTLAESLAFYAPEHRFLPGALAIDPDGGMFVYNTASGRVLHLERGSGLHLDGFEKAGPLVPLGLVTGIAVGHNGELIAVESSEHRVLTFRTPFYEAPEPAPEPEPEPEEPPEPVTDYTRPAVYPPPTVHAEALDRLTAVDIGNATATDDGGIRKIYSNAPESFRTGATSVTWIATDNAGNSETALQQVMVYACGRYPSEYNLVEGTEGSDVLDGTDGDDLIFGLGGDDVITGLAGDDCIFGGGGDDLVSGGGGNDTIRGNAGDDILRGDAGDDAVDAGAGMNLIDGGDGSDSCHQPGSGDGLVRGCE